MDCLVTGLDEPKRWVAKTSRSADATLRPCVDRDIEISMDKTSANPHNQGTDIGKLSEPAVNSGYPQSLTVLSENC